MIINDLQETIRQSLNEQIQNGLFEKSDDFPDPKKPIFIKYMDKDDTLCFVPNPGSHVVEQDYSGVQYKQYNYAFTIRTTKGAMAKTRLFKISQYLQTLSDLKSINGAPWRFDHIEVPSEPAEILQDLKGTVTYSMDVAVFIYTNKGVL